MEGYDRMPGRFAIVTDEVTDFLYGSGEIPVQGMSNRNPNLEWAPCVTFSKMSILGPISV